MVHCSKNDSQIIKVPITGKWNLNIDSIYTSGIAGPKIEVYHGISTDYWDFRVDGKLYIQEGTLLDTLNFNILTDSTMFIDSFGTIINGQAQASSILSCSRHQAIIRSAILPTPDGIYIRTIFLVR